MSVHELFECQESRFYNFCIFFFSRDIIKDLSVTLTPLQGYDKLEVADAEKSIKKVRIFK